MHDALIGLAAIAALIAIAWHLKKRWEKVRSEMGPIRPNFFPQHRYFDAWRRAAAKLHLSVDSPPGELAAPRLSGSLRGLQARIRMALCPPSRQHGDPKALNPASTRCRIATDFELPFPWHRATLHRPGGEKSGGNKDVELNLTLSAPYRIESVRLPAHNRRELAQTLEDCDRLVLRGGSVEITHCPRPPRDDSQWPSFFVDRLESIGDDARTVSDTALRVELKSPGNAPDGVVQLQPGCGPAPTRCRAVVRLELNAPWPPTLSIEQRKQPPPSDTGSSTDDVPFDEIFELKGNHKNLGPEALRDALRDPLLDHAGEFDAIRIDDSQLIITEILSHTDKANSATRRLDELLEAAGTTAVELLEAVEYSE